MRELPGGEAQADRESEIVRGVWRWVLQGWHVNGGLRGVHQQESGQEPDCGGVRRVGQRGGGFE